MKILAGIPTRLRDTSGKIADVLAESVDEVYVVSQGATVNAKSSRVTIVEKDVNYGLVAARNEILRYANEHGYEYVIQSDDDLAYTPKVIDAMIEELLAHPTIGSIASSSRAYCNWNKDVDCSKNFLVAPCAAQLWISETSILNEVGLWDVEFLEDRDHGARMWKLGYAVMIMNKGMEYTHNPFIARTTKSESSGGQEQGEERRVRLGKAIDTVQERHGDILSIRIGNPDSNRTIFTRYKWNEVIKYPVAKYGYAIGYEDSKGKKL